MKATMTQIHFAARDARAPHLLLSGSDDENGGREEDLCARARRKVSRARPIPLSFSICAPLHCRRHSDLPPTNAIARKTCIVVSTTEIVHQLVALLTAHHLKTADRYDPSGRRELTHNHHNCATEAGSKHR